MKATLAVTALGVVSVAGHGAIVSPRSRQSVDYLAGVNTMSCANATGDDCNNGQAAFYYRFVFFCCVLADPCSDQCSRLVHHVNLCCELVVKGVLLGAKNATT